MAEELKPCPFCGASPVPDFCSSTDGPTYLFHCQATNCPAWPNVQGDTEAEAIAAWNTRTPPTPTEGAEIERMGEALFTLSDALRKTGALESDHVHIGYENVVDRWNELTATLATQEAELTRLRQRVAELEGAWKGTHFFVDYDEEGEPHHYSEAEAIERAGYEGGDIRTAVQVTLRSLTHQPNGDGAS